jgi:DNA-binding response OmpR family regulator
MAMLDIVIADDDAAVLAHIACRLESKGYRVRRARNGGEALELVRQQVPDVAIVDIIMPERDGIETITELRRSFPSVMVLAMSGGGKWGHLRYLGAARKLGAHDILMKPFSTRKLIDAITMLTCTDRSESLRLLDH